MKKTLDFLLCVSVLNIPVIQGRWEHTPTLHAINVLLYRCIVQGSAISRENQAGILVPAGRKEFVLVGMMLEHNCNYHEGRLERSYD